MTESKILIVEDELLVAEDIKRCLKRLGYSITGIAENSENAIELTQKLKPDLILMDIVLKGGKDGIETAEYIYEHYEIPIIYLTAYGDRSRFNRAKITDPFGYITKPFDEQQLSLNIEIALYKSKIDKEKNKLIQKLQIEIDERKRAEKALLKSEQRLKNAQQLGRIGGWEFDVITRKFIWSDQAFVLFERDPVLGELTADDSPNGAPDETRKLTEYARRAIEFGESFEFDFEVFLPSGKAAYMTAFMRPVKDKDGRVLKLNGAFQDITERKRAEEALKEREQTLNTILDASPSGVVLLFSDYTLGWYNKAMSDILGYEQGELERRQIKSLFLSEKSGIRFAKKLDNQIQKHGSARIESRMVCKDGEIIDVIIRAKPMDVNNPEKGLIATIDNITDRVHAEKALRESEERYRNLVETSQDMIFRCDREGRFTYLNKAWEQSLGYSIEEMIGREPSDFKTSHIAERDTYALARILKGGKANGYETIYTSKFGNNVYMRLNAMLLNDKSGNITGTQGTAYDITESKKASEALKESEQQLRLITDNLPMLISYLDSDLRYRFTNKLHEDWFKCSSHSINGKHIKEILGEELFVILHNKFCEALSGRVVNYESNMIYPDGHSRSIKSTLIPHKEKDGTVKGLFTLIQDITESKQLEGEHIKASKLESIGILASGIAHDFNNILAAILGNISLAKMFINETSEEYEILTDAENASFQAKNLTQQLLTFSKSGSPAKETTNIADLIKDSARFILRGSNVKYRLSVTPDLWTADVDRGQIVQSVNNFIINAQQAMSDGGTVSIKLENITVNDDDYVPLQQGNYIKISISDQGTGIPKEYLSKIFDPYFTTKQKGNGLGLASSYSIINRHDGHIAVESEVGVGASFHVYLPATPKRIDHKDIQIEETANKTGKILIMDDEEMVCNVVARMLKELGNETVVAHTGAEAVEQYKMAQETGHPFDVAFLDLTIPGGAGGKETLKDLREIDPDIRAIILSGYTNDPIMNNFTQYGFKEYITKPFKLNDLKRVLKKVLT